MDSIDINNLFTTDCISNLSVPTSHGTPTVRLLTTDIVVKSEKDVNLHTDEGHTSLVQPNDSNILHLTGTVPTTCHYETFIKTELTENESSNLYDTIDNCLVNDSSRPYTFYYAYDLKEDIDSTHATENFYNCLDSNILMKGHSEYTSHGKDHKPKLQDKSLKALPNLCNDILPAKTHDKNISVLKCSNVNETENSNIIYQSKNELFSSNNKYKCNFCSFSSVLMKYLRDHLRTEHDDKKKHIYCYLCGTSFTVKRSLEKHVQTIHQKEPLICAQCDFKTRYRKNLVKHMAFHTSGFSQLCYICGFQNSDERNMNIHIYRHSGIKHISCSLCSYQASTISAISRHMLVHTTERRYPCDVCSYRCRTKQHLNIHKQTHLQLKTIKCDICNYRCSSNTLLNKHMEIHSTARKHFLCAECGKGFLKKCNLKYHELAHSNKKLYTCSHCPSNFVTQQRLIHHLKLHTGEGRMYCFKCKYSSTHKGNFVEHVNKTCAKARNAKEKLMFCYQCDYASSHRSNFINHVSKCYLKLKKRIKRK